MPFDLPVDHHHRVHWISVIKQQLEREQDKDRVVQDYIKKLERRMNPHNLRLYVNAFLRWDSVNTLASIDHNPSADGSHRRPGFYCPKFFSAMDASKLRFFMVILFINSRSDLTHELREKMKVDTMLVSGSRPSHAAMVDAMQACESHHHLIRNAQIELHLIFVI